MLLQMILQGVVTTLVLIPSVYLFQFIQNKIRLKQISKILSKYEAYEQTFSETKEPHQTH